VAWITATCTETQVDAQTYKVEFNVSDAGGIEKELFVMRVSDDSFSHVALVYDLKTFPNSKQEALTKRLAFYRVSQMQRTFEVKPTAANFSTYTKQRLAFVTKDWAGDSVAEFGGITTVVYSSDPT